MKRTNAQGGFTLVELMLSMVFLAAILMLTTLLLVQSLNIYNKGLTTKQINQVSRTMMEELIRTSNSGTSISLGANCLSLDDSLYIWNVVDPSPAATTEYLPPSPNPTYTYADDSSPINFVKLVDVNSGCAGINPNTIDRAKVVPLVSDTVRVYSITHTLVAPSSANLVRFSMVLGTYTGIGSQYNLLADGSGGFQCPADSLGAYCAKGALETVLYLPNGIN